MNKFLIPLLLVVVAGLVYLFAFTGNSPKNPDSGGREKAPEIGVPKIETGETGPAVESEGPGVKGEDIGTPPERRESSPHREREQHPQGVRGRVLTSQGGPAVGAQVYLVKTLPAQDMLSNLMRAAQQGTRARAQVGAQDETGANGQFELAAPPSVGERSYQLHVVAPGHEVLTQAVRINSERWQDLALLRLKAGRKLTGFVRHAETNAPVEGATVQVKIPAMNLMMETPGFEDGSVGISDKNGRYVVDHLPVGTFEATALARGYGRDFHEEVAITENDRQVNLDFKLGDGFEIQGIVTDSEGKPVPNARIQAYSFSREHPTPSSGFTDESGRFELLGLAEGSYRLEVNATEFLPQQKAPVKAGAEDVHVTMERLGQARITVTSKRGRPLSAYRLELRSYFEGQETFGRTSVPAQEVRAERDGSYLFSGIPTGNYVFQVTAIGYAKTYSPNFTITPGSPTPANVLVTMNEGGTITGTITDTTGNPIAGVSVKTLENTHVDNPFFTMFKDFIPQMVTHTSVSTDERGQFTLKQLMPSTYQLRMDHPSYSRVFRKDVKVEEAGKTDIGVVRLEQGGTVSGKVFFQGRPVVGAEVSLNSAPGSEGAPVYEKAYSGPDGTFRIARPLPAGSYEISASRTDVPNPFLKMKDMQTSKKEVRVFDGRDNPVQVHIKP